jgi:hypothetical protein
MSEPDAMLELRRAVATQHGLPEGSEAFLRGETLQQLEASAVEFAAMLAKRGEPEPEAADLAELFSPDARARREQRLTAIFTGRAQPRDQLGRFAAKPAASFHGGFDGGARRPVPVKGPPEKEHNAWLVDVLRHRRADAAGRF